MVKTKETIEKASRGVIKDYYNSGTSLQKGMQGLLPKFDRDKVLEDIRTDSTVISAITTLVDKSLENGWRLEGKDKKSNLKTNTEKLKEMRFNKLLRQILYNIYAYNNAFIENVKDGNGNVKELHLLETTTTEPLATEHGEIVGYIQNNVKGGQEWTPDQVTHIAVNTLTTGIWGEIDLQSVHTSVLIKQYVMAYIGWLTGTNQLRGFYNIKDASDNNVKDLISHLRKLETDINKPLVAAGEIEYTLLRDFAEGSTLLEVMTFCDNNIRTLLQVPPISLGQPDSSNRSNSDTQEGSLYTRIKSIFMLVEDSFDYDLFPKIGMGKTHFVFNPVNRIAVSRIIENAMKLKEMNVEDSVMEEYLKFEGFPIKVKFKKIEDMVPQGNNNDLDPSRRGKLEDESSKKIGSGEESSTRQDQLIAKGSTETYDFYANNTTQIIEEYEDESIKFTMKGETE